MKLRVLWNDLQTALMRPTAAPRIGETWIQIPAKNIVSIDASDQKDLGKLIVGQPYGTPKVRLKRIAVPSLHQAVQELEVRELMDRFQATLDSVAKDYGVRFPDIQRRLDKLKGE